MESKDKKKIICIVCGNDSVKFFTRKDYYDFYKCKNCNLIFVWPLPQENDRLYSTDYFTGATQGYGYVNYEEDKKAAIQTLNTYLDKIEKFLPNRGKLLDVGTATGHFLQLAKDRGWQVKGVELSDYAVQKAREANLEVVKGTIKDLVSPIGNFDVITYLDVFEHVFDPVSELESVYKILKTGGLLVINTPDSSSFFSRFRGRSWHLLVPPEHIFIFNPVNLAVLLKRAGFEVILVCKIGKKFTLQYVFQFLANRYPFFIWHWLAKICKHSFMGKLALPINLRDNMFIIAKK